MTQDDFMHYTHAIGLFKIKPSNMDNKKKLSKCIIKEGKELLKELGIEFQDMEVERAKRTSETLKQPNEYRNYAEYLIERIEKEGEWE